MSLYQCNSCDAKYVTPQAIGGVYIHVCGDVVIRPAEFDANGSMTKAAITAPRPNARNENKPEGFIMRGGVAYIESSDPHDSTKVIRTEVSPDIIVSEGKGRKLVVPDAA
jgi:hypothetical protein